MSQERRPIVIAHRGASGERPEHTMGAYERAIAQGCDFIEPDLVMTRDGVLVCRHENEISETTNVAAQSRFADRRARKIIDGVAIEGWFVEDFTLEELKVLRCKERLPRLRPANCAFDGQEQIPTFAEALALARARGVGIYPELKHPSFLIEAGLDPVPAFVRDIEAAGFNSRAAPIFAQCFEMAPLRRLKALSPVRRIQLMSGEGGPFDRAADGVTYRDLTSADGLRALAEYCDGIGVEKAMLIGRDAQGALGRSTGLCARAHEAALAVHAWTFRAENYFLPRDLQRGDPSVKGHAARRGDLIGELIAFYREGVDGVFSDFTDIALAARAAL